MYVPICELRRNSTILPLRSRTSWRLRALPVTCLPRDWTRAGVYHFANNRRRGHDLPEGHHGDRPRSVTAGILRPGSAASSFRVGRPVAAAADSAESLRGRLPGREAGRLGMGPAVVPGQDPAEVAGRPATGRWQIWQRVTRTGVTVTGSGGNLDCSSGLVIPGPAR